MSFTRYKNRRIKYNSNILIKKILDEKNISFVKHYSSPNIKIPSYLDKVKIRTISQVWKRGDKLSKYAEKYYTDPELWWIIALYNNKPTDAHFKIGDIFYIPTDLNNFFQYVEI